MEGSAAAPQEGDEAMTFKERMHLLLDEPTSSWKALFVAVFIMGCILASTLFYCLESMPRYEKHERFWLSAEVFFVAVFSVEYLIRFWATPVPKGRWMLEFFNLIDLAAIAPFYIELIAEEITGAQVFPFDLRVLRVVRVLRLFKAGKYSDDVRLIMGAMYASREALLLLICFLLIAAILFAAIIFTFEQGTWVEEKGCYVRPGESICSPFNSIPEAMYWAITTITTVGYGDTLPTSKVSQVICCLCMISGLLVLALPVTMIGVSFS